MIIEVGGRACSPGEKAETRLDVEIYAYVSDAEGRMRDFFNRRVALDLAKDGARKAMEEGGIKYYGHFDLEPGSYHVRVLVRNAASGRTGVQTVQVSVPAYAEAQPVLLPPFFMEDRQKWLLVREQTGGGAEGRRSSTRSPSPASPTCPPPGRCCSGGKPARLCLVAYNLGKGDLAVKGEVLAADGKAARRTRQAVGGRAHGHRHPGARQAGRHLRSRGALRRRLRPAGGGDRPDHGAQTDEFSTVPGHSLIFCMVDLPS